MIGGLDCSARQHQAHRTFPFASTGTQFTASSNFIVTKKYSCLLLPLGLLDRMPVQVIPSVCIFHVTIDRKGEGACGFINTWQLFNIIEAKINVSDNNKLEDPVQVISSCF